MPLAGDGTRQVSLVIFFLAFVFSLDILQRLCWIWDKLVHGENILKFSYGTSCPGVGFPQTSCSSTPITFFYFVAPCTLKGLSEQNGVSEPSELTPF